MTEENPHLEYKSINEKAAHMCGHDGHVTCLLGGAAKILERIQDIPEDKVVRLLFQPAEENWGGAYPMIQEGCLEGVDEVYGMHNWPTMPVGTLHVKAGPVMAEGTTISVTFIGRGGHGSAPQKANDPLQPAIDFHLKFREMIDEFKQEGKGNLFLSTLTQLHVGETDNVIAEKAVISGTVRSFDSGFTREFKRRLQGIVDEICKVYQCENKTVMTTIYPVVINGEKEVEYVKEAAEKVFGKEGVSEKGLPVYASEDFSYFLQKRPGAFFFLGTMEGEGGLMLHNPHYDFNDEAIERGSEMWMRLAEQRFGLSLE